MVVALATMSELRERECDIGWHGIVCHIFTGNSQSADP